jgi:GABA(A) receptor-associated protein
MEENDNKKKKEKKIKIKFDFKYIKDNPDAEKRKEESTKILSKFPDKVPVICEKDPNSKILHEIDKSKFLVSNDLTGSQFNYMVRKKLGVKDEESAFYLLVNGSVTITGDNTMSEIYESYKNPEDGFLYIIYTSTQIWG